MSIEIINGIEVDTEKAEKLVTKLIIKEKKNLSTREYGKTEMIKKIKKMIEEDVECY